MQCLSRYSTLTLLIFVMCVSQWTLADSQESMKEYRERTFEKLKDGHRALHDTSRVTVRSLERCFDSSTSNFVSIGPVACPCFLKYIVLKPRSEHLDVFFVAESSYNVWKTMNYSGDPPLHIRHLGHAETQNHIAVVKNDTNVFLAGQYRLVFRLQTTRAVCFEKGQYVFESMPTPCPMPTAERATGKIVGGTKVSRKSSLDSFRWMCLISHSSTGPRCGGAHIAPGYVLTAAHCLIQESPSSHTVQIGTLQAGQGNSYKISRMWTHPLYARNDEAPLYDFAILELGLGKASISEDIILLNRDPKTPSNGEFVTAAGFGHISEDWNARPSPNHMRRVDVPIVPFLECKKNYSKVINEIHMCAGYSTGGCDSCQTDSGGPLRYIKELPNGSKVEYLVGIVSFGEGCARSASPGVYARVSAVDGWITETLRVAVKSRTGNDLSRNHAAIIGISVAVLVVTVVTLSLTVYCCWFRRKQADSEKEESCEGSDVPSTCGISV